VSDAVKVKATRGDSPLHPNATPAVGDVLHVNGVPFTLTAILSAGRDSSTRYYRFTDPNGNTINLSPNKK
jgi:hypothetical protein